MSIKMDLKQLATMKVKIDLLKEQLDKKLSEIKEHMISSNEETVSDPDGYLKLVLVKSQKRVFSIDGVKAVLGEKAIDVIEESVSAKKFDAILKSKGEYVITEEEQKHCFTTIDGHSITWKGLDVHKNKLAEKVKKT